MDETWVPNQANLITFVMVDANGTEVPGLGAGYTMEVSKAGGAFAPAAGTQAEISDGWYSYLSTAAEANTVGPVSIRVNGAGCVQQNLEYVVEQRTTGGTAHTYTVLNTVTGLPIAGVSVLFYTDALMTNLVWSGITDAFGVARDAGGFLPVLTPGTYTVRNIKAGYTFPVDTEVVP